MGMDVGLKKSIRIKFDELESPACNSIISNTRVIVQKKKEYSSQIINQRSTEYAQKITQHVYFQWILF